MEKVLARLFKRKLLIIGLTTIVVFLPIVYLVMHNPKTTAAAWFDDSYSYRQLFSFTHNAAITSERSVTFSLDTAELIAAGLMQSDCDDTRFTDTGGDPLRFQLTGTCNNAATTYEVVFPSIINGTNSAYVYYGNPAAVSASQDVSGVTALTPSGGDPAITDRAVEEQGTTPVLYWKFDEGSGTTANDSTQYSNNGTFKAAGEPVIQNEEMCALGKCVKFDGSNDYVTKSYSTDTELDPGTASFSVSTWFRHSSTISGTDILIARADGLNGVGYKLYMNSSGFMCFGIDAVAGSFPNNSACGTTSLADSQWHFIEGVKSGTTSITLYIDGKQITQTTSITTSSISGTSSPFYAGIDSDGTSNPWDGFIDDIKVYNYAKSASQTKTDFVNKGSLDQVSATLGSSTDGLSSGLVGYWKMDESAANSCAGGVNDSCDSSGNGNNGAWGSGTTVTSGKFGNGTSYDNTSNAGTTGSLTGMTADTKRWAISAWFKTSDTSGYIFDFRNTGGIYVDNGPALYTNGSDTISIYWSCTATCTPLLGAKDYTYTGVISTDNNWHHVVLERDGDNSIKLYVDGTLLTPNTLTTDTDMSTFAENWANFTFGLRYSSQTFPLSGSLDDVRVYNRALSTSEVRTLYDWAPSPIGYWSLDEGRNTTANDISGNGNTGTISSTTNNDWIIGKYGKALNFDATDNDINAGSAAILDDIPASGGMTLMAWVYFRGNGQSNAGRILDKSSATATNGWDWRVNSSDKMTFDADFDGASNLQFNSTNTFSFNTWQHVAITWDGSANRSGAKYYVNGVEAATTGGTDGAGNRVTDAAQSLHIGNSGSTNRTFDGLLDDVKVYNYIRTPKQIVSDMNGGHPAVGSPIGSAVGYWKMDEGTGVTAHDQSINANDLTLSAASWTASGKFDKAWNGTGSVWLTRADDDDFDFAAADNMSISMWFKSDSGTNPTNNEYLLEKGTITNTGTAGYALYANSSGNIVYGIKDDAAWGASSPNTVTPDDTATSTTDLYDNTWHHIVATKTGTSRVDLYVDGKLNASDTSIAATATLANAIALRVGDDDADSANSFNGDLDEIKVYRYALNADEVKVEYNQGKSVVLGALSTTSGGVADNSSDRSYCIPGDTTTCSGPVAEWKFDEGTGTTANDTSGNANTGTLTNGPMWTTGKLGKALSFDGSDDYVDAGSGTILDNMVSFTVSAWIYPKSLGQNSLGRIVQKSSSAPQGWSFLLDTSNRLNVSVTTNGTALSKISANNSITLNTWQHVTMVYGGDVLNASLVKIYVNGVETGYTVSTNGTGTRSDDSGQSIFIGDNTAASRAFDGMIDNVEIFNYARTPAQVAWDYNRGAPIGWWKLDEGIGLSAHDASGNAMTGTLTNSPTWSTSGKYTNAVTFSGSSSNNSTVIDIGDQSKLEMTTFTLSAWVNRSGTCPFGICSIFSKGMSGNVGYSLELFDTGGSYKACMNINDSLQHVEGTSAINTGAWYHILATVDGTTIKVYVNGKLETSTAQTQTPTFSTETAKIGNRNTNNNVTFNGIIDDVSVFNYVLNPTQVRTLYNEHAAIRFGPVTGAP